MRMGASRVALICALIGLWSVIRAEAQTAAVQTVANSDCGLKSPSFVTGAPNIFNDRQEQDLGDALAELTESELHLAGSAPDDALTRVGEKLLATLPPTGIRYRFRVYDSGEINGFSLAGGRVYLSRKLVAAVKNEDELAGVVAHELGHISTHQTASELTRLWRIRLGVTQVTDREDIFAKVHLFFSTPPKPAEGEDREEEKDQLIADNVALYAMVRAGYAPASFSSFLNDSMLNKGKTGNAITDFFGLTHEASRRYRRALKLIGELPMSCQQKQPASGAEFVTWQRFMVEERGRSATAAVTGDQAVKLNPPLRPSLWRVRFSQDGKYVLAQDESSVTVVERLAGKVLFRVDAPEAEAAQFTPDSRGLVFHDRKLRVERWDVSTGERVSVKEMVVYDGCNQAILSADGKTLVCATLRTSQEYPQLGLRLIDVESGKVLYEQRDFVSTGSNSGFGKVFRLAMEQWTGGNVAEMVVSPDGRYALVAAEDQCTAFDLENRRPIALNGKLKDLTQQTMSFLGPDQLYVVSETKNNGIHRAQILSFPEGNLVKESQIGDQEIEPVSKGRMLLAKPLKNYPVGVLDPEIMKFVATSQLPTIDAWDKELAAEDALGGLQLSQVGLAKHSSVPLPLGPLPKVQTGEFSSDGKYLAISLKNRAELWDATTGKPIAAMRPFRYLWIDGKDTLMGQMPKYVDKDPEQMKLEIRTGKAGSLGKYEREDWQYRQMQYRLRPMGKAKDLRRHATLEVRNLGSETVAWTRDYAKEIPAIWNAEDDRFVFAWDLSSGASEDEIKSHPALQQQASLLKNRKKGMLLQTVVPETGVVLEEVVIPEADLTGGSDDARRAEVSGEYVLVRGEHGNTVIYRLDTGARVGEFFGSKVATDAGSKRIAAVNREEEILLVDEETGKELTRFSLGSPVRLARIVGGKQLLVLTADQVVHHLPIP